MTTSDSAETLEELAVRVRSCLEAACALVTRVTEDRQYVLAHAGRQLPDWFMAGTTLDYSICQHSVAMDFPLVIDDALSHPLLHGSRAVSELNIAAYIGAPVHVRCGKAMGTICAVDFHLRRWTEEDINHIIESARVADRILARLN